MAEFQFKLSAADVEQIAERIANLLDKKNYMPPRRHKVTSAALKPYDAARYIGVSRTRFYELLLVDQELADAAISIGSSRLWPVEFLDRWLAKHQGKKIEPRPDK
jgi:hypothetical protein